ncbi:hypothetical protein KA075_03165 [Candidatus Saccharibacteria bacterium]|jgi:hypothetical protein|nr:hypothetical protein [Candidatus Saccharibacteria bacterium]
MQKERNIRSLDTQRILFIRALSGTLNLHTTESRREPRVLSLGQLVEGAMSDLPLCEPPTKSWPEQREIAQIPFDDFINPPQTHPRLAGIKVTGVTTQINQPLFKPPEFRLFPDSVQIVAPRDAASMVCPTLTVRSQPCLGETLAPREINVSTGHTHTSFGYATPPAYELCWLAHEEGMSPEDPKTARFIADLTESFLMGNLV